MKLSENDSIGLKQIVRPKLKTNGQNYEDMRSLVQELSFAQSSDSFLKRNLEFGEQQRKSLGLQNMDGVFTNLGLLLSDQCAHTVKVATFEGITQSVFKDRREFSGSLLQQLNQAHDYIDFCNYTRTTFEKLLRVDARDYPEIAVREALLNSLVHRDYSYSANTLISVYDDRLEFVSVGGLVPGISLEDVMLGLSVCRNPKLANVFYRLKLIESYGTGLQKIMTSYQGSGKEPKILATENAFKIILPNLNAGGGTSDELHLEPEERRLMLLLQERGSITRQDAETHLGISQTSAGRLIKQMIEKGLLSKEGKGKATRYVP